MSLDQETKLNASILSKLSSHGKIKKIKKGKLILREGSEATCFYILQKGRVSLECFHPSQGPVIIETLNKGDLLGWSWLVSPYKWHFDALVLEDCELLAIEAAPLRAKMESDDKFAYEIMKFFFPIVIHRMQSARMRLLDLYSSPMKS